MATNGSLGKGGVTNFDISGYTGLTSATLQAAGTGSGTGSQIKAANTTDVNLTVGAGDAIVTGGKAVNVTTAGGVATVTGDALTTVTVKGAGNTSTVENTVNGAGTAGTTLTAVTFDNVATGATAKGDALNTLTLKNQASALAVALTNTSTEALTINVENAGYDKIAKALVAGVSVDTSTTAAYKTVTVNSTGDNQLTVTAADATGIKATGAGNVTLTLSSLTAAAVSFDGSAATGDITLTNNSATTFTSVKTGGGDDVFDAENAAKVAISTGAGDDTVSVDAALAAGTTVALGAGNDKLLLKTGSVANSTATETTVVDGGDGTDTLALALVGSANVGVFKNFEVFDAVGLGATLDTDLLAGNNSVTEFVASNDVGAGATLTNVAAGIGFRATGDMGSTNALTLTQKVAGALTVTLDADSTDTTSQNDTNLDVAATNATSLKAVFGVDSGFVQTAATTNDQAIILTGSKATTLEVVSGGTNASNTLTYVYGKGAATAAADGLLTAVTITGSQNLSLDFSDGTDDAESNIATIDATSLTGKLTVDVADLKFGAGLLKLGSGADTITFAAASSNAGGTTANQFESISGFSKAAATAVSSTASATDIAAAIAAADQLVFTSGAVANASTSALGATLSKGVLTFTGAGPATLDDALVIADDFAETANEALAFQFAGNTYVFVQGATHAVGTTAVTAADGLVKLVGVTGITNFAEDTTTADHFFIV